LNTNTDIESLARSVAAAVADLRRTLEQNQLEHLELSIAQVQVAIDELNRYPGGADELVQAIQRLPSKNSIQISALLGQARLDHEVSGQLIRLAQQRNAALQAYTAQADPAAIYSSEGGVPMVGTPNLLGKF